MDYIDIETIVEEAMESLGGLTEIEEFYQLIESADTYYTEAVGYAMGNDEAYPGIIRKVFYAFRAYIQTIIEGLRGIWKSFHTEIKRVSTRRKTVSRLKELKKEMLEKKDRGRKMVSMPDMKHIADVYRTEVDSHWKNVDRMMRKIYVDMEQMESDYNEIVEELDLSSDRIIEASSEKIMVPIKDAIKMVEDELSGRSMCSRVINEAIYRLNRMNDSVDSMARRIQITEENKLVPKKLNFIQRIIRTITAFIGKVNRTVIVVIFSII